MKLSQWAKKQGLSYGTALKWFHEGKLPVGSVQLDTGTILVQEDQFVGNPNETLKRIESSLKRIEDKLK